MTSLFESFISIVKTFMDDDPKPVSGPMPVPDADPSPKPPMHVGEVMDVWKYLAMIEQSMVIEQIGRNMTTDSDLLGLLNEAISICSRQCEQLKNFMVNEGVPIPALPEVKPKSTTEAVPMGVKLTDDELANFLAGKLHIAVQECCRSMSECVRNDIALMWGGFLFELGKYGAKLKTKMMERGWLKVPPAYHPPGIPVNNAP